MRKYKIRIVAMIAAAWTLTSNAYDCKVDGICYNLAQDYGFAEVTYDDKNENRDYGNVIIPEYINYAGNRYAVEVIGEKAFSGCKLSSIKLPETVTHINDFAFAESNLTNITLPVSLTAIGQFAFKRTGLTSIVIPKTLSNMGFGAFAGCPLASITVEDGGFFDSRNDCNAVIGEIENVTYLVIGCKNTVIPQGVDIICKYAFRECEGLESVIIPEGVIEIGSDAFNWCTNLRNVTLPNTVKTIREAAFFGCKSLEKIELPESVTWIENHAFCYGGLTSVVLPKSVSFLGVAAFAGCPLTSIVVAEGNDSFDSRGNCNAIICEEELCAGCKYTIIPSSVTKITDFAFKGCKGLETITIPNGVTTIGEYAFYDCTDLKSIVIPASVEDIYDNAFEGCTQLTEVTIKGHPELGDDVFKDCPNLKRKPKQKIIFRDKSGY